MFTMSKGSFSCFLTFSPLPRSRIPECLSRIFLRYLCDTKEHKDDLKSKWLRQDQCSERWSAGACLSRWLCLPTACGSAAQGSLVAMWSLCSAPTWLQQLLDWSLKEESVFCQLCGSSFSMRMRLSPGRSEKWMWQGATMCICELFLLCGMMI